MSDASEIKALLQAQIVTLARELAPDGTRSGAYWIARNPTRNDAHAGSFWVALTGTPGAWRDEATGDKGDVFQLVGYIARTPDFPATLKWCREWLRIGEMTPAERQRLAGLAKRRAETEAVDRVEDEDRKRRAAMAIYFDAKKRPFPGSPADRYLKARGIEVEKLGRMPGVLGWRPAEKHRESGTEWPVLVAAFTGPDDKVCAVHRTWLDPHGLGKAPVNPVRKIWPHFGGAAIRLWRGGSKMSTGEAARHGLRETLVLVEGVEDGLSVALAMPELRVWAAGSLGNLAAIRLPECIDDVVICADNDWGKQQAQRQLDKAVAALTAQGAKVRVARSHVGKDVNDALRGTP